MNKKEAGNAIKIIWKTIVETHCCVGDEDIKGMVEMLRVIQQISAIWDLKEYGDIPEMIETVNMMLRNDKSEYRIILDHVKINAVKIV